jgi:hypothetical protein
MHMPLEDFVGRWITENDWRRTVTIEIDVVDSRLVVRAIRNINGELAEIHGLTQGDAEIRFAAHWPSGQICTYRLMRSGDRLAVSFTISDTVQFTRDLNPDGTNKWRSGILHIAPGSSAGGSLIEAVRASGRSDNVLSFPDDLSCGPIDSDDASSRATWWASVFDDYIGEDQISAFWKRVTSTSDRIVVWFGQHSAREHAFFLALADRLGDRPFNIIDVTGLRLPVTLPGDQPGLSPAKHAVSIMMEDELASLFESERPITKQQREDAVRRWRRLKSENAPFRIVTETGLISAPADTFDELLLGQATKEWRKAARVIADVMSPYWESYIQTSDIMLQTRLVALVEAGKLLAHGDPWVMRKCEVRLPDTTEMS